jgi:hypothetical protein
MIFVIALQVQLHPAHGISWDAMQPLPRLFHGF